MHIPKPKLERIVNEASLHAVDGWSFNVCMAKCGIKSQQKVIDLARAYPEIGAIKAYCDERRNKFGFATSATIYRSNKVDVL